MSGVLINTAADSDDVNKDKGGKKEEEAEKEKGGRERGSGGEEKGKEHGGRRGGREGYYMGSKMERRCHVRPDMRLGDFTGSGTVFHASDLEEAS